MAEQARIASLEEEVTLAQEVARSQGEELDDLRRQLRAKELGHKELAAAERLAQAELAKASASTQDLEEMVGALREELRAKELTLLAEKEARRQLGEQAVEWQRQLGEASTRLAEAAMAEKTATEKAAAADAARALAVADAERAHRDAAAASEAKASVAQEAAAAADRKVADLTTQVQGAQELVREQAAELATLRESSRANAAEIASRGERLQALGALLESSQSEKAAIASQLGEATHEVWEGALQQRLRREQTEAVEARLSFLQSELSTKDERLRSSESDAAALRASLREQQAALAEAEQTLQKMRVIDAPALRDEVRQEQSRAAASDAKAASLEAQLAATSLSLAEARQAGVDKEQSVAQAHSLQLAAELKLADADQRVATQERRAAVSEAEARAAVERHAALMDVCTELRATLRRRDDALAEARERERTREQVTEPQAQQRLEEAKRQASALEASLAGREERHTALLETLAAMRRSLAEREAKVRELTERISTLETIELPAANEAAQAGREQAATAAVSIQGGELRLAQVRKRFDEAQAQATELTGLLTAAEEAKNTAVAHGALQAELAAAAQRQAALATEQHRGEALRAEELAAELREARETLRSRGTQLAKARADLDAAAELREAAEDAAALEAQRARSMAFDLEMARDAVADERSKLRLQSAELLSRDDQIRALSDDVAAVRSKWRERGDRADELHERLRLAAGAADEREAELSASRERVASLELAVTAKDEQIELVRSKLRATAQGKAPSSSTQSLAASAEALSEELRIKDDQLALLRQSISVMEEELLAKEGRAGATEDKHSLLQRECAARDEQIMVLSEKLQAAQLEIKIGGSKLGRKNEELSQELKATKAALANLQQRLDQAPVPALATRDQNAGPVSNGTGPDHRRFFHNLCLLLKVLLASQQKVRNLSIDELYQDVTARALPIEDYPEYIHSRFTGAEPKR